ncbi:hypothetical protein [Nitrososphaera sp.]|uniref:hypothetical protein n=1 Tax=Nitrososphaera sp. TaxID=1971748 RepID=UPI0017B48641|nr:hypothetical protein [Nitrososphaera sp.]NWG36185.1 hypothetical protein [Nitrososphaera sp.]
MDPRVKKAVLSKIGEAIESAAEIKQIQASLKAVPGSQKSDFAFGIAVGRIYNSFHYQTRRIIGRNATEQEFSEFLQILSKNADRIREACQ